MSNEMDTVPPKVLPEVSAGQLSWISKDLPLLHPKSYKLTDDHFYKKLFSHIISWHFHVIMNDFMTPRCGKPILCPFNTHDVLSQWLIKFSDLEHHWSFALSTLCSVCVMLCVESIVGSLSSCEVDKQVYTTTCRHSRHQCAVCACFHPQCCLHLLGVYVPGASVSASSMHFL